MGSTPTARSIANGTSKASVTGDTSAIQALVSSDLGEALADIITELTDGYTALNEGPREGRPEGVHIPSKLETKLLRNLGVQLAAFHAPAATETTGGAS